MKLLPSATRGSVGAPVQGASETPPWARVVAEGLTQSPRSLPPFLFYDAEGSRLYELITQSPEYYPTRTERAIFQVNADDIVARASGGQPISFAELGAGTATKTQILLRAAARKQDLVPFLAIDVSASALEAAQTRMRREASHVRCQPFVGDHREARGAIAALPAPRLLLFIGSSIGNLDDDAAVKLLSDLRDALDPGDAFLLGTDLRKDPAILIPAYDDAAGVTAAFNKNVLVRLNRELGADFDLDGFDHQARWNDEASRIEMHLVCVSAQRVRIPILGLELAFAAGESIHTESSIKYDDARVRRLLDQAGFAHEYQWRDPRELFAVHLARYAPDPAHDPAA